MVNFEDILGSFWDYVEAISRHFGIILRIFCGEFGVIVRSFWSHLGSFWGSFGDILGYFGDILGHFENIFRSF